MGISRNFFDNIGPKAFDAAQRLFLRRDEARAERLGESLANLARIVDRKHAQRTVSNLELAFPEWTDAKRHETAKEMYHHFGRVLSDFMRMPDQSKEHARETTEIIGFENFAEAEALGKGVLMVTGHFGNWERMGNLVGAYGRPIAVIVRDANQSKLNRKILAIREQSGFKVLSRGSAARAALQELKAGGNVALLPDQNADDLFIPFFGKPCGTVKGPAVLHQRTSAPVLTGFGVRTGVGRYRLEVSGPLVPVSGYDPIEGMMRAINEALEAVIRRHPEQWLWMHDRWKSARQRGML